MPSVKIRRQLNDHRISQVELDSISDFHWDNISGGVYATAPQAFVHGYVWCNEIDGDIAHSCNHGPPPHSITVVILQKDNSELTWQRITSIVGEKPKKSRAKPYNPKSDADEIVNCLLSDKPHPAIEHIKGKLVIKPRNIDSLENTTKSIHTIKRRAKALTNLIREMLKDNQQLEITNYSVWLAFEKRN